MMYTNKQLLQLTLPLFAEQFLIVFVGVADTFMVSYAGETLSPAWRWWIPSAS